MPTETPTPKNQSIHAPTLTCLMVGRAGGAQVEDLIRVLQGLRCEVERADGLDQARDRLNECVFDLVVLDTGDSWVDAASVSADWVPAAAVAITCDTAGEDLSVYRAAGAAACVAGSYDVEQIADLLAATARSRYFASELARLQTAYVDRPVDEFFVGRSPVMRRLDSAIRRACEIDASVLIEGAPGTGKSLIARTLHMNGRRCDGPLVSVRARSLNEESLIEALEEAANGTLLIESIEEMPSAVQSRLVRHLKERSGADSTRDARLIATTGGRLAEFTAKNTFREDLYYRLNVFPMQLPLLKERVDDIAELADLFLRQASAVTGTPQKGLSPSALILLETNPWPGNVAQLRNAIYRAHVAAGKKQIDRVHLIGPVMGVQAPPDAAELRGNDDVPEEVRESDILPFQEEERRILSRALKAAKGNVRQAAELLGIGRATLYRKIQIFELSLS